MCGALIGALFMLPLFAVAQEVSVSGRARAEVETAQGSVTAREAGTGKATGRLTATGTTTVAPRLEEARQKLVEKRGELLKRFAELMVKRMTAAIDRLTKLADRLDSRIAKEKARGVNTSAAEANIALARTKLADARAAVADAKAAILAIIDPLDDSLSNTKPGDAGKLVREELRKAKDAVFAAHKALVQAIVSLKGTRDINGRATTTTSATTVQ
ncbi:MAG: hypothetical protein A2942_00115 [Candidatus Lloydbacteria bacterium RIFCSPLOWO2_01_FULL_50_20]|uniref:DUF5667 domain-containing protein n=1 Tax=Candidatus Lloydbacteria bacterium RIFCSPLOWO2_01_FULL_50_20 TaxID=1798665 RepID=A0A1G2DJL6_9BACT|nr:MAG: hypothetical protein A3C13_00620 [Candidatus Lloydbacteria bacterium RIFCSPHIGHO2_02_FULL_50_11]OGZ13776.1 MAG: hypothetical protein A2942_00115 [Candidatus Lloydbacteria bacterium RIFCSPLOWO2_01_FULL_50_20]